ncbi:hypothetical protein HOLleu_13972 [Holothuria leucospilota]|uniref:Uncharacterized protein n=1 Tax=Holothuria leucospilota TaxID=206669 RepID=A0A9Q1C705_HOLLE|nr:hypothetical protein HOLleu_13972 [Holothuria leucospilota]
MYIHATICKISWAYTVIYENGLSVLTERISAVENAPAPKDVSQLRSYLGMLSYNTTFLPINLSTAL